jgi:indolepyruvate ferredoxin oxidoreductase
VKSLVEKPGKASAPARIAETLDDIAARRAAFLTAYQNAAYGRRYADRIATLREAEIKAAPGSTTVTEAAAKNLFKLMAIKDEYEVARLYTDGSFVRELKKQFQSYGSIEFHLAPPILGRRDADGRPKKSSFGPWMMQAFRILAALKGLRGTAFDVFGYNAERRLEKKLLAQYEGDLDLVARRLSASSVEAAAALLSVPALIRGYGYVKHAAVEQAAAERARLVERFVGMEASPELQAAE